MIKSFSDFWYVDPFLRYSRSKLKVVKNLEKFWAIFWPSQIFGGVHCKNCTQFITPASRGVDWKKIFRLKNFGRFFDMLICSGDIRDQSRKLSKIGKKIWAIFWPSQIFGGWHCKNCTQFITPASRGVDWKKSREDTPTSPEVIESNTLNFRPDFSFSWLNFFYLGYALRSLGQFVARVKISWRSTPWGPRYSLPKKVR